MALQLAQARIKYHSRWVVAYMEPRKAWLEIRRLRIALAPKAWEVQPQRYDPHVTVLRLEKEDMPADELWALKPRDGELVEVAYDTTLRCAGVYWFFDAWSPELMAVRVSLGLKPLREGYFMQHITMGNMKK